MLDLDVYKKENNVDLIIDLLSKKPIDLIENVPAEYVNEIRIDEENCRFRILEFFNADEPAPEFLTNLFADAVVPVSKMQDIVRVMFMVIDPNTIVPEHVDDDDPNYRIINVVYSKSPDVEKVGMSVEDKRYGLTKNFSIGIDASVEMHGVWNYTDQPLIIAVTVLKEKNDN